MEAILDVLHTGCYTSRLTLDHAVRIAVLSGHRTRRGSVGLWEMTGEDAALPAALDDLARHPHIAEARVVHRAAGRWILETLDTEAGVSVALVEEGLVFLPPVLIEDGRERYRVFAVERAQVERAVKRLRAEGNEVRVASARETVASLSPLSALTEQQRRALEAAHRLGYYERPRAAGQDEVARAVGLSRPTVAEHLQLAEKRVMDGLLGERPPRTRSLK